MMVNVDPPPNLWINRLALDIVSKRSRPEALS